MIPNLTPAELRTAVRVMAIYAEATAHILAEEIAADAAANPLTSPSSPGLPPQVAEATEGDPSHG